MLLGWEDQQVQLLLPLDLPLVQLLLVPVLPAAVLGPGGWEPDP